MKYMVKDAVICYIYWLNLAGMYELPIVLQNTGQSAQILPLVQITMGRQQ